MKSLSCSGWIRKKVGPEIHTHGSYRICSKITNIFFFSTGYIDLSKRRVSPEDVVKCEERFNKSKMVHSILRHVAEKVKVPIEDLYQKIGWPLMKKYGHTVDAFKYSITWVC